MTTRWINPSDCVDMDCDARRKMVITDVDGSFIGVNTTTPTTAISESEYGWDSEPVWGLGDSKIPNTMLTNSDGSRINVTKNYPYKGYCYVRLDASLLF